MFGVVSTTYIVVAPEAGKVVPVNTERVRMNIARLVPKVPPSYPCPAVDWTKVEVEAEPPEFVP